MTSGIHPSAVVSEKAVLGANVEVGPFTLIHDHVEIGAGTVIGSHCELGVPSALALEPNLVIGENSLIRSHSIFYAGSTIGPNLVTGHRVTVRENTRAGSNFQLGTLGDVQGHCLIGDNVRTQSGVYIAQKSRIGNFVWLFPHVVLTNDPHPPSDYTVGCEIEDFAVISANSVVLPGVRVGRGAVVGAMCLVTRDVPPETLFVGVPGREAGPAREVAHRVTGEPAYPWRSHFSRGYPEEETAAWREEFGKRSREGGGSEGG